jgi:hypothetical protein
VSLPAIRYSHTVVTTEGDEVKLACVLSSFEAYGHGLDFIGFELRSNAHSCDDAA